MIERHYTPKQCAELLGGAVATWRSRAELIGAFKVGRTWHIPETKLQEFLDKHQDKARAPRSMEGQ